VAGFDEGKLRLAGLDDVADAEVELGDPAVGGRRDGGPLEVELGQRDGGGGLLTAGGLHIRGAEVVMASCCSDFRPASLACSEARVSCNWMPWICAA